MVILGHSDFVEIHDKNEGNVRWISPQFYAGAPDSEANYKTPRSFPLSNQS